MEIVERNKVREHIANNKNNTVAGIAAWLGKDAQDAVKSSNGEIPVGWEASFHGIKDEVERHAESDAAESQKGDLGTNAGGSNNPTA